MGGSTIQVQQTLHGYSEGHRLLASSIELPKEAKRKMLVLSDMSGPNMIAGFEEYLTAYSLEAPRLFVLSKTWDAPEMNRPGCVWSHSLLIKDDDVSRLSDLSCLLYLFRRPSNKLSASEYEVVLRQEPNLDLEKPCFAGNLNKNFVRRVLYCLYGSAKNPPVVLTGTTSKKYERFIVRLWSQQWPSLRRSFTFCTGSLSSRLINGKPFDLQVMPTTVHRHFSRNIPNVQVIEAESPREDDPDLPGWLSLAVENLLGRCSDKSTKNLLELGRCLKGNRFEFSRLFTTYQFIEAAISGRLKMSNLIDEIALLYPNPNDAEGIKKLLFGPPDKRLLFTEIMNEKEILRGLSLTENSSAFLPETLQLGNRAASLLEGHRSLVSELVSDLIRCDINSLGENLLIGVSEALKPRDLLELAKGDSAVLFAFVERKPTLAAFDLIWRGSPNYQRELFDHLIKSKPLTDDTIESVVSAMLDANADGLASDAYRHFGQEAVAALLNWYDRSPSTRTEAKISLWFRALKITPEPILSWFSKAEAPTAESAALVASLLNPNSSAVKHKGIEIWLKVIRSCATTMSEDARRALSEFLLPFGLNSLESEAVEFCVFSFEIIHEAVALNELSYDVWRMFEPVLPELPWYRSWDKCERLRRGLVKAFYANKWPTQRFYECTNQERIFELLIRSARGTSFGRHLLKRLHDDYLSSKANLSGNRSKWFDRYVRGEG